MVRRKKKKATTATKRRRPALNSASRTPTRRRRSSPRRKGMAEGLAEEMDFTKKDSTVNKVIMATVGSVGYKMITQKMPERKDRAMYGAILTLVAATMGQGRIAVGIAAACAYDYLASAPTMAEGLSEEVSYITPEVLSDGEPAFLDAEGFPILREQYNFYQG